MWAGVLVDKEFGEIIVRKNSLSRRISFSVSTSGRLQASIPAYLSENMVKKTLEQMRSEIRVKLKPKDPSTQRARDARKKMLIKQAREYLPYRLEYFAKRFGYHYDKIVLSHAGSRWGSCTHRVDRLSSKKTITISLNIGLMQVPEAERDYVIIHELAHINHPDHSKAFWAEVERHDPNYLAHREILGTYSPGV